MKEVKRKLVRCPHCAGSDAIIVLHCRICEGDAFVYEDTLPAKKLAPVIQLPVQESLEQEIRRKLARLEYLKAQAREYRKLKAEMKAFFSEIDTLPLGKCTVHVERREMPERNVRPHTTIQFYVR